MTRFASAALALLLLGLPGVIPSPGGSASAQEPIVVPGPTSPLTVTTATGVYPFQVELADDPRERSQGLMWRRRMDPDHGMLFDMGGTGEAGFWMENTYVSLDIAFIGEDGRIVSVAERTVPLSKALIPSRGPVRFVLEVVAGTARRIGMKPGDKVSHRRIDEVARAR